MVHRSERRPHRIHFSRWAERWIGAGRPLDLNFVTTPRHNGHGGTRKGRTKLDRTTMGDPVPTDPLALLPLPSPRDLFRRSVLGSFAPCGPRLRRCNRSLVSARERMVAQLGPLWIVQTVSTLVDHEQACHAYLVSTEVRRSQQVAARAPTRRRNALCPGEA